jgi:hypothetical protein
MKEKKKVDDSTAVFSFSKLSESNSANFDFAFFSIQSVAEFK